MSSTPDQTRYAYPKYKVFIYGVEVTDDCVSINKTEHDGNAPGSCSITLLNEFDKYICTTQDMMTLVGMKEGTKLNIPWLNGLASDQSANATLSGPEVGSDDYTLNVAENIRKEQRLDGTLDDRKASVLINKNVQLQRIKLSDRKDPKGNPITETDSFKYYGTSIKRYPIADGSPIFNAMDPVRVAMRDPFNPNRWYWHFSGFVSDIVDNSDENNAKTLTIVCEDPTKLFRYTRVALNPGVIDANAVVQEEDLAVQTFWASFLSGFNLPEMFFTLIFGPDKAGTEQIFEQNAGISKTSNIATRIRGIGHFALDGSTYCTFGPEPTSPSTKQEGITKTLADVKPPQKLGGNALQTWQSLIDHEVQPSDLWTMATEADRQNESVILERGNFVSKDSDGKLLIAGERGGETGVIDYIGTHPEEYLIDGGRLMMLVPNSLGSDNSKILLEELTQSNFVNTEWSSVGEIMKDVVDRIQFVMYASPRGDIVIEPPLYDFDPDDFGLEAISGDAFLNTLPTDQIATGHSDQSNAVKVLGTGELKFPGRDRGPYGANYIILKRDTFKWESAFVDEKVYTVGICANALVQNWPSIGNTSIIGDMAVVRLPDLIPLYGVRPAPITPPGYIASPEGAALYANIQLNKLNADAHTFNIQHVPNIKLWVNRPLYIQGRNCIATTKQVTQSITWGAQGDMSSMSDVYAVRTWNGLVSANDKTEPIFTTIGGLGSHALNYKVLFKTETVPDNSQGNQKDTSLSIGSKSSLQGGGFNTASGTIDTSKSTNGVP